MSILATGGCWTWFNDPRAVYSSLDNSVYFGWKNGNANNYIASYDVAKQKMHFCNIQTQNPDDHDNPSVIQLHGSTPNNPSRICAGWSKHTVSNHVSLALTASRPVMGLVTTLETTNTSYCHLVQLEDTNYTIFNFFRVSLTGIGRGQPQYLRYSTDGGNTWAAKIELFSASQPYFQICKTSATRMDFLCTEINPQGSSVGKILHFYITIASNGKLSYYKSDGTNIGTDTTTTGDFLTPTHNPSGDATTGALVTAQVTTVYSGSATWVWDLCKIGSDVCAMYATFQNSAGVVNGLHNYYFASVPFAGGSWTTPSLVCSGGSYFASAVGHSLYPNTDTGAIEYSGGMCLDPNDKNSVYVSLKYGERDFRVEKWAYSAGTWTKTIDVSGNTSSVNARPSWVHDYPTTQILYWSGTYTTYANFSTNIIAYPDLTIAAYAAATKPAFPVWNSSKAPAGTSGYWPIYEGSGAVVNDLKSSGHNGSFVNTPTWATGSYGAEINGFSISNYITIDPPSPGLVGDNAPAWFAIMIKNTSTSNGWAWSEGSASGTTVFLGNSINSNSITTYIEGAARDSGGGIAEAIGAISNSNDGNYHVMHFALWTTSDLRCYWDGSEVFRITKPVSGNLTCSLLTLGVLRRDGGASLAAAFPGTIVAAACGSGTVVDPFDLAYDWLAGKFSAITPLGKAASIYMHRTQQRAA